MNTAAVEILARKREASDALQESLDARLREAGVLPALTDPSPDADIETATGTITQYAPWALPRGHVVIEFPSRRVEAEFPSFDECERHAAQLNEWLARRPAPDARYRLFVPPPEPTEAALVEAVDRMYDATALESRAFEPVAAMVAAARPVARAADRKAREERRRLQKAAWKWEDGQWVERVRPAEVVRTGSGGE